MPVIGLHVASRPREAVELVNEMSSVSGKERVHMSVELITRDVVTFDQIDYFVQLFADITGRNTPSAATEQRVELSVQPRNQPVTARGMFPSETKV